MKTLAPVNGFSFSRFIQLCRRTFALNQRTWLIGFAAVAGFIITIWALPVLLSQSSRNIAHFRDLLPTAFFFYTLGGLLLTSAIFNELHTPATAFRPLTLPATSLEKFISAWIISMPIFTIASILALFILSLLIETISATMIGTYANFELFNPLSAESIDIFLRYFFLNSLFLLGAVYFKKNNFLKTALTLVIIFITLITVSTFAMFLFIGYGESYFIEVHNIRNYEFIYRTVWAAISLGSLTAGYLILKKRQIV